MNIERESILKACAVLDLLEAGWEPGEVELASACYVDRWALLPASDGGPLLIIGYAPNLPASSRIFVAPVFAIDRKAKWAWIADEWVVVGEPLDEASGMDDETVQDLMSAWLRDELKRTFA